MKKIYEVEVPKICFKCPISLHQLITSTEKGQCAKRLDLNHYGACRLYQTFQKRRHPSATETKNV